MFPRDNHVPKDKCSELLDLLLKGRPNYTFVEDNDRGAGLTTDYILEFELPTISPISNPMFGYIKNMTVMDFCNCFGLIIRNSFMLFRENKYVELISDTMFKFIFSIKSHPDLHFTFTFRFEGKTVKSVNIKNNYGLNLDITEELKDSIMEDILMPRKAQKSARKR